MGQAAGPLAEIAIHEAGHFVVAHYFGHSISATIDIEPNGDTASEVVSDRREWDGPDEGFAKLVELLAGYRAQMRVAPLGRSLRGASHDLEMALRILQSAFAPETRLTMFFKARRKTDEILAAQWECVLGIAGLLMDCRTIDGEAAEMWLDYARGVEGVDAAAVSHYLTLRAAERRENLDRESVPTPEDVAEQWKRYVRRAREACALLTGTSGVRSMEGLLPARSKHTKSS